MLSKSLIQFSLDGWSCVPSLLFESEVAQPCSTLQHHRLPGSPVSGIFQVIVLEWFAAIPFSNGPFLSELSTMTCLSWVAPHGMDDDFIELNKAVVHVISLVSFL